MDRRTSRLVMTLALVGLLVIAAVALIIKSYAG
ncbi:hypothetical protein BH11ACT4_BH11ACT4_16350 [soil metagenome]